MRDSRKEATIGMIRRYSRRRPPIDPQMIRCLDGFGVRHEVMLSKFNLIMSWPGARIQNTENKILVLLPLRLPLAELALHHFHVLHHASWEFLDLSSTNEVRLSWRDIFSAFVFRLGGGLVAGDRVRMLPS
jgi:hypothetical protein